MIATPYAVKNVVAPSFTSVVKGKLVKLTEPEELAGTYVLVESYACGNSVYADTWCLQLPEHAGPCWNCSEELFFSTNGSWAKLVSDS